MTLDDLIHTIERLHVADDEVLVVRPRSILMKVDADILQRNIAKIATAMGWGEDRIVMLERDIELIVVKAEQLGLDSDVAR